MTTASTRRIALPGWDLGAARAAEIAFDPDAVARRVIAGGIERRLRGRDREEQAVFLRPPPEASPEDPAIGRWAVVVLEEDRAAAREALAPLLARRATQGWAIDGQASASGEAGVVCLRKPASKNPERYWDRLVEATGRPPHHVLLVGGPDRIPFEAQAVFDREIVTGRIDAGSDDHGAPRWDAYRAWAEKVVRYEEGRTPVERRALLYSFATDDATRCSHEELMLPLAQRHPGADRLFGAEATTARLCDALASSRPALVITASHGIEGFDAPPAKELWGALTDHTFVGANGIPLDAARVRSREVFAPGAVVVSFACFSAGVPRESAHRVLTEKAGGAIAGAPFTAALPQALLAHPEGPIAFVGHVDRATSESFRAHGAAAGPAAFLDFMGWWLGPSRGTLGQAMSGFRDARAAAAEHLAALCQRARSEPRLLDAQTAIDAFVRHCDAEGYVLLGDPATKLAAG